MKHKIGLFLVVVLASSSLAGCTKAMRKARWLSRAEKEYNAGEYDKAKIDYIKVAQVDAQNALSFSRLGEMWLAEGSPLQAGPFLKRASELDAKDVANRLRLARVYTAVGLRDPARKEVITILQQAPDNGEALILLTELAQKPDELTAAKQALEKFPKKESASFHLATANIALRDRDLGGAENAVRQAVAADPKSAEAHVALAVLLVLKKDVPAAAEEMKTAAQLAPARSGIQITAAEFQRQTGAADAARASLKAVTDKAPDFLPAWIVQARIDFEQKKYDEALQALENVFSRDPQNIDARLTQSDIWLAKKEPKKVIDTLDQLDAKYPGLPAARFRVAQAYIQQNNPTQAEAALDQAIAKNPDFAEAIVAKAEIDLRTGKVPPAMSALEGLLKKRPDLKPAQVLLADAYRASGRLDDAAAIFNEQIKAAPNAAEPHFFLGLVRLQQKKDPEARQSFEKALELAPDNVLATSQLVDLDLKAKDFVGAEKRVQGPLQKHPEAAPWHFLQGKILAAQQKWPEAEASLKKAIELDGNMGPAYDLLVSIYLATNKLPEAARELETVISKNPKADRALMSLALIEEKQNDFPKARDAYEKVLEINPDFVPALNNLAYLYGEHLNQLDRAGELARKARTTAPDDPSVADTFGWILFKRGEYQQALLPLQQAADKVPESAEIKFHLAMAHYMMGQTEAARAGFQQALAAPGDFPSRAEAQSRLGLLGEQSGSAAATSVADLEKLVAKQPNDLVAWNRLAGGYEKQGAWAKAAGAYERVLKLNPQLASAALKLAQLYGGPLANKEKAMSYAKTARSLAPQDPKTTAILGRIAYQSGDFPWSFSLLQESARTLESDPQVQHDLAWAAYSNGKVDDARAAMERCLKASPDAATAEDAKLFLALTAPVGSGADFTKSTLEAKLAADPKYVPALMADAALAAKENRPEDAIKRYRDALQRFPDFAPAQKELARLYAQDPGKSSEAYDYASKARKAMPNDPEVALVLGQVSVQRKEFRRGLQLLQESARAKPLDGMGQYYLGLAYDGLKQPADAITALRVALSAGLPEAPARDAQRRLAELQKPGK